MKTRVEISINFQNECLLDSVFKSLEPDNIGFPENIDVRMKRYDTTLWFRLVSKNDISSLLSILDDMVESVQITYNTLKSLKVR